VSSKLVHSLVMSVDDPIDYVVSRSEVKVTVALNAKTPKYTVKI